MLYIVVVLLWLWLLSWCCVLRLCCCGRWIAVAVERRLTSTISAISRLISYMKRSTHRIESKQQRGPSGAHPEIVPVIGDARRCAWQTALTGECPGCESAAVTAG